MSPIRWRTKIANVEQTKNHDRKINVTKKNIFGSAIVR